MLNKTLRGVSIAALVAGLASSAAWGQIPGLKNQDVGMTSLAGSTTFAGGKYTIVGGGADIWGAADGFHFAYITVTGDFDYIVKCEDLQGPDGWSKAELMAREVGDGADPDGGDRFIASMTTRSGGQNEVALQWRSDLRGGGCAWPNDIGIATPVVRPAYPNTWLRLERIGNNFWGYNSTDGTTWSMLRGSPYVIDTETLNGNEAAPRTEGPLAAKLAIGMAVTAHNDGDATGGIGVFSGFAKVTPVPIAITTQPPATLNVAANSTLTISVVATGDPVHYQWYKGADKIVGATSATYTKPLCQTTDSGSYTVKCYQSGQEVTSSASVATVTVDTTAPTLVSAKPVGQTGVRIQFSEPVSAATAEVAANYTLVPATAVSAAALSADGFSVSLTTASQQLNTMYTLTVKDVKDTAGNTIAAGTTATFTSVSLLKGFAYYERWDDGSGDMGNLDAFATAIADGSARPPDVTSVVNQFGGPWGATDNYNGRVRTYFTPPSNGNYVFFVSADDGANVYLSTDDKPANKKLIANEAGWSNQYQWTAPGSGAAENKRSDQFPSTEWADGATITLSASKTYFMEVLWNEGGGGDGADVTFIKEGDADPANNTDGMKMRGNVIAWYESTDVLPPSVTAPTGVTSLNLAAGATATMSVVAEFATGYQWQRDGVNIVGATTADYVITGAKPNDIGQYWCRVSNKNGTVQSQSFFVTVTATGVFAIEAEDFDYDSGQTKPEASVMPYLGGAYAGLSAVLGVDYQNDDDPGNNMANGLPVYRSGGTLGSTADDPNTGATMAAEQPGGQNSTNRLEWTMTANYKLGWVGTGNWGNYTRTFPTPAKKYNVFAASSADNHAAGRLAGDVGVVTAGVGTATQTVTKLASYNAPGTGAWSRNSLVPMREADGTLTEVELGGKQTIRWNYNGGDAEFLLFIPASGGGDGPKINSIVKNTDGTLTITWTGGGTLQAAEAVTGPWQDVAGATSPYTLTPTAAKLFGRIKK
jgi:hypothetical protein